MKPLPSLSGIEAFDAVARHLSFSKSGHELGITQAAVSHRIRILEEELGIILFLRTSRSVQLTTPGRALNSATSAAFQQIRTGLSYMDAVAHPHRVTVSCSPSFAIRWLVPRLGDFKKFAPDLNLHISAEDKLVQPGVGTIDICIRFGSGNYQGVNVERLTQETVTPVCSPHYLEKVNLDKLEDLKNAMLLHDDALSNHPRYIGWKEWNIAHQLALPSDFGPHFSHSHMALDAATASQGVALARHTLVRQDLKQGLLITPFKEKIESQHSYWLISPKNVELSRAAKTFQEWLREALS